MSLAIAVALHNIPEGMAVSTSMYAATKSKWAAIKWSLLSGLCEPLGAFAFGAPPAPFVVLGHPFGGILFGLAAGAAASGGYDLIKSVLGLVGGNVKSAGTTKDDAARARL